MRKSVTVTFTASHAALILSTLESTPKFPQGVIEVLRDAINAPPTPEQLRDAAEEAAGFDREMVEDAIRAVIGDYGFFESNDPGVLAFGEEDFRVVDKLTAPNAARSLADAAGYPLSGVETCDWSFDDRCDESAISVTFDLSKTSHVVADALELIRDEAADKGWVLDTDGVAETAVAEFETLEDVTLPTKTRDEIIARLRSGA